MILTRDSPLDIFFHQAGTLPVWIKKGKGHVFEQSRQLLQILLTVDLTSYASLYAGCESALPASAVKSDFVANLLGACHEPNREEDALFAANPKRSLQVGLVDFLVHLC